MSRSPLTFYTPHSPFELVVTSGYSSCLSIRRSSPGLSTRKKNSLDSAHSERHPIASARRKKRARRGRRRGASRKSERRPASRHTSERARGKRRRRRRRRRKNSRKVARRLAFQFWPQRPKRLARGAQGALKTSPQTHNGERHRERKHAFWGRVEGERNSRLAWLHFRSSPLCVRAPTTEKRSSRPLRRRRRRRRRRRGRQRGRALKERDEKRSKRGNASSETVNIWTT